MSDMETRLAEMFGFRQFEPDEKLQNMIIDTLKRYDNEIKIPIEDLAVAAGGLNVSPPENERSDKK